MISNHEVGGFLALINQEGHRRFDGHWENARTIGIELIQKIRPRPVAHKKRDAAPRFDIFGQL
jgi:hypothetical protein